MQLANAGQQGGRLKGFKTEELFTEAILNVTREKQTAVYLLTGHQELEPFGGRQQERISAPVQSVSGGRFSVSFSPYLLRYIGQIFCFSAEPGRSRK